MKFILINRKKAFTLLEILITIIISSVIVVSTLLIFFNVNFDNLNQRKYFTKVNEIEFSLNYIENELKSAIKVDIKDDSLIILNYSYNGFSGNVSTQKIKNVKKVVFKKILDKKKISVYRISQDLLNKLYDGKNKLISMVDDFNFVLDKNKLYIKISYKDRIFEKHIFLRNLKRFEYEK